MEKKGVAIRREHGRIRRLGSGRTGWTTNPKQCQGEYAIPKEIACHRSQNCGILCELYSLIVSSEVKD